MPKVIPQPIFFCMSYLKKEEKKSIRVGVSLQFKCSTEPLNKPFVNTSEVFLHMCSPYNIIISTIITTNKRIKK